ncbi:MAG: GNAT family N-acetyltransferase [Candidatus Hodarchaeota archaeon]
MGIINIETLKFEQLSKENIEAVYQMCEANVLFISRSFQVFERHTLGSDSFDPELSIVAKDDNNAVAAFFMAVLRRSNIPKTNRKVAVLKFFVVEKNWRNIGLGTKLFNIILERIKTLKKKNWKMNFQVHQSQPDYWTPGLDPRHTEAYFFLKKHGFKKGNERVNLWIDLENIFDKQPPSEFKGYKLERAKMEDKDEVVPLKFMPITYRLGFWPDETELTFRNDPITTFIARDSNNKVVGWASHSMLFPGNFGPTGVKPSERGKGLGSVLLDWCLWDMKQMGVNRATIMWVVGNTVYFYLKSRGAHICEFYWPMKRKV